MKLIDHIASLSELEDQTVLPDILMQEIDESG